MFTGIIEEIGKIKAIKKGLSNIVILLEADKVIHGSKVGDSISVDGVCLTITKIDKFILSFDVMKESLGKSTLGDLKPGDKVNLERSLQVGGRLGGHFVSGHVDYKGKIESISKGKEGVNFKISMPGEFSDLIAPKGSVSLDGASLTVGEVDKKTFTVYLIPHTLNTTTLGNKKKGGPINVEVDLIAKYLSKQSRRPNLESLLKKYSYI